MRVITGLARGFSLKTLDSEDTRPATDRVKENIFNLLIGEEFDGPGADIFAGSGALGIEMLSRGASSAVFVEANEKAADVIVENLNHVSKHIDVIVDADSMVKAMSYEQFIANATPKSFQWIFLDPPFPLSNDQLYGPKLIKLFMPLLKKGGVLIYRQHRGVKDQKWKAKIWKDKTYGINRVIFFVNE